MQTNVIARIKSAPRATVIGVVLGIALLLVGWGVLVGGTEHRRLSVGEHVYQLEVVRTSANRQKGLSGRASLPKNQGMLFVYRQEGERCFWMKDMRFSLDIIWLNAQKEVVHVVAEAQPGPPVVAMCSPKPAQFVIELSAGEARAAGVTKGTRLNF